MKIRLLLYILMVISIALVGGGVYGFNSLLKAEAVYEPVTGVVEKATHQRIYKRRKPVMEYEILIFYDTPKYGKLTSYLKGSAFFFLDKGDKVDILYHPEHPREVRYPLYEKILWSVMCGLGIAGCTGMYFLLFVKGEKRKNQSKNQSI